MSAALLVITITTLAEKKLKLRQTVAKKGIAKMCQKTVSLLKSA